MVKSKLFLFPILLLFLVFANAALVSADFNFNLTVKYTNGSIVDNATVSLLEFDFNMGPPTLNQTHTNYTNSNGVAFLSGLTNASGKFYQLNVLLNESGNIKYVGPILHEFPAEMFQYGLSGAEVYLEEAVAMNITVYYGTNSSIYMSRGYDIIDGEYGNHLGFLDESGGVTDNLIYLPLNGTYSFNIHPNETAPLSVAYEADGCLNSTGVSAGDVVSCSINGTVLFRQVYGYLNTSALSGFDSLNGINYVLEAGDRVFAEAAFTNV
ncbi:MAG: hypothetical protein IH852_17895, partial [Bacteroidetes bacterium]|nr:hypothetical protein [Bacteroidota bacterium]